MAARKTDHGEGGAIDELQRALEDWFGLRVTHQELEAPTPALVTSVLREALRPLGLNEAVLDMPHSLPPSEGAHIEGTVFLLNLLALMQSVFLPLGIEDVGLSDLVDPEPRRTRRLFLALVNTWPRVSSIFNTYMENEQNHLEAMATQGQLDACTARVNEMRARLASSAKKKAAMTAELADYYKTLEAYSAKKAAITADYHKLNVTHCASYEAVQRAKMELGDVAEALKEVQAAVCEDPASWKKKIDAQAENLANLEQERDQRRCTVLELEEKISMATAMKEALRATLDDVGYLEARVTELEALKQVKEVTEEKRKKLEHQHCDLENKVKAASEELARLDPKTGELRDIDAAIQDLEQRNSNIRRRCEEMEAAFKTACCSAELSDLETATASTEKEIGATNQLTRDHVARNQEEIDRMVRRIGEVAGRFQELYNPDKLPKV